MKLLQVCQIHWTSIKLRSQVCAAFYQNIILDIPFEYIETCFLAVLQRKHGGGGLIDFENSYSFFTSPL